MSLMQEALAASVPNRPKCTFAQLRVQIDDGDGDLALVEVPKALMTEISEALADHRVTGAGLAEALRKRDVRDVSGKEIKETTVRRHRHGKCGCESR